jgi:4a-hydroxytetrahydrobiopterin dehydratase
MTAETSGHRASARCISCEGTVERLSAADAEAKLQGLRGWRLIDEGRRIRKDWKFKDFKAGVGFLVRVAQLAEQQGHHPDLHLERYRHVWIAIWTHSIGGLSANDFALAAMIDQLCAEPDVAGNVLE